MDWTDLPAYHRAVLSAHQVRAEYSLFLIDLWQEIWQSALDESSLYDSLEEQSVQKTEKSGNQQLETFSVWEYEEFYRFFEALEGFKIGLTVSCNPEDQVQLGYWVDSKYRELIETAKLGSSWHITAENSKNSWIYNDGSGGEIQEGRRIDLQLLQKAASEAIASVKSIVDNLG